MPGGGYVLAINVLFGVIMLGTLAGASAYDRRRTDAKWWLLALVFALASAGFEISLAYFDQARFPRFMLFATHLGALILFSVGISAHYAKRFPWRAVAVFYVASLMLNIALIDLPRDDYIRQALYQFPYFAAVMIGAVIIGRSRRTLVDFGFMIATSCFALQFMVRPFIAYLAGGMGAGPAEYLATSYGAITQAIFAFSGMFTGAFMVALIIRGIIGDLKVSNVTDSLSGLLNRRGFQNEAERILSQADASGARVALAIVDIDHFKAVNDTHGHATGDKVIQWIGALLNRTTRQGDIVGRLGGEEFGILFANADTSSARLWCEGMRAMIAAARDAENDGLPRITASFGVTSRRSGEALTDFFKRADEALYQAKRRGRDRVCARDGIRYTVPAALRS